MGGGANFIRAKFSYGEWEEDVVLKGYLLRVNLGFTLIL